ncbi:zinc finger bed domain-containing protein 1-like [Nannochloropsis oceanica]
MSDMSSDEEGVAAASTTSSLAGSAREADARERGKRAKDLDIYPTAPRQDKEKSFVWRSADFGTAGKVVPAIFKLQALVTADKVKVVTPRSGPNHPGSSAEVLATDLHPAVQEVRQHMAQDMATRFHWDILRDTFAIASLLDPRFKKLADYHVPEHLVKDAWGLLRLELDKAITTLKDEGMYTDRAEQGAGGDIVVDSGDPFAAENTASRTSAVSAGDALGNGADGVPRSVLGTAREQLLNLSEVYQELADYIRMPVEPSSTCPLDWWRCNKRFFPALAKLARQYLCVPATSAGVERFFSAAGLTISNLRTRLSSKTVEMILFLRLNWDNSLYTVELGGADLEEVTRAEEGGGGGEGDAMTDAADEGEEGGDLLDDDEEGAALQPMGFGEDDDFAWLNEDLFYVDFDIES